MAADSKPKFLKTVKELISPDNVRRAIDTRELVRMALESEKFRANADDPLLDLAGRQAQSKGGHAKAAKLAEKLQARDQKIRAEFAATVKKPGEKRHVLVTKFANIHKLSPYQVNKILRAK
jgi:hypothetical protein